VSRFNYAASNSASQLPQLYYRTLVNVGVTSGTVYACNGAQYLYAMGNTYAPTGALGAIDPIQEESDPFPRTVRCTLQATGSASMYEAMREDMFGRPLKVYHVFLDDTHAMVSTPELLWNGLINKVQLYFNTSDKGTYIEVEADTDLRRAPPVNNYNRESMLLLSSGDTFCNFVDQIPLSNAKWGLTTPVGYSSGGGAGGKNGTPRGPQRPF
jgi:hypothetical protein